MKYLLKFFGICCPDEFPVGTKLCRFIHYVEWIVNIEISHHFILVFTFLLLGFNMRFYLKKVEIHNRC